MIKKISFNNQIFYILTLRNFIIFSQIIAAIMVQHYLQITLPLKLILLTNAMILATSIASIWLIKRGYNLNKLSILFQLMLDIWALTYILYLTGGSANPFAFLYIIYVIMGALLLEAIYSWLIVIMVISCYSVINYLNIPIFYLNHYHLDNYFNMIINGIWINFVIISIVVAYFILKISKIIDEQNNQLNLIKEDNLKDEHIITIGALAAGAAHELSTPLAIISLLNQDLIEEYNSNDEVQKKLLIIKNQIDRCKQSLSILSSSSGIIRAEGGGGLSLDQFFLQLASYWQTIDSTIKICLKFEGRMPAPTIATDKILQQIINNVVINAIQAAKTTVVVNVKWADDLMNLTISDDGAGISGEIENLVGQPFFTTKSDGKGLGLFLTKSTINKLGGDFKLVNKDTNDGAQAEIVLDLTKLLIDNE